METIKMYLGDVQVGGGEVKPTEPLVVYEGGNNTTTYIDEKYIKHIFKLLEILADGSSQATAKTVGDYIQIEWHGFTSMQVTSYCNISNGGYGNQGKFAIGGGLITSNNSSWVTTVTNTQAIIDSSVYAYAVKGSGTRNTMYIKKIELIP